MKTYFSTRYIEPAILCLILLSTALIYWKTLGYGYYFDDSHIFERSHLISFSNLYDGIRRNRPFSFILWLAISTIWGLKPSSFHGVAVVLHLLCGLSFYCMLRAIIKNTRIGFGEFNPFAPLITSAIFLLHPLQTESVVYSFQAMSVLPTAMSCFIAITCYVKYRSCGNKFYLSAVFLLNFFASTSRESAIVLPVCLWIADWIFFCEGNVKESFRRWPIYLGCLGISAATIAIGALSVSYSNAGMGFGYKLITPFSYLTTQFVVIMKYLRLFIIPFGQNLDHDIPVLYSLVSLKAILSLLALIGILTSGLYSIKKNPMFSFGILWFFLFLSPTSTIMPIKDVIFEHRLYVPIAGLIISLVSIIKLLINKPLICNLNINIIFRIVLILVVVTLGSATYFRLNVWENSFTLWSDVIKKSPNKAKAYNNLGYVFVKQGNVNKAIRNYVEALKIDPNYLHPHLNLGILLASQKKFNEAMSHYSEALRLKPDYDKAHYHLGNLLFELGNTEEAMTHYSKALKINPYSHEAHFYLGLALEKQGNLSESLAHYSEALRVKPQYVDAHNNLGNVLARVGRYEDAMNHYNKVLKIKPNSPETYNKIGLVLMKQGKTSLATDHFYRALKIDPNFVDAHYNLGTFMEKQGEISRAVKHYNEILRINPGDVKTLNNLGIALARQGKLKMAITYFSEALKIDSTNEMAKYNLELALRKTGQQ